MPRQLEWTPILASLLWDGLETSGISDRLSFGKLNGAALVEFITPFLRAGGRVLDYGGGSGHLVRALTEAGIRAAAFEPSAERAHQIRETLGGSPNFLGVIGPNDSEQFDLVTCTEVIEHIPPEHTDGFLAAMLAFVAPGGRILLTTPHREDMRHEEVYCPVCDHIYHKWQHQQSWTVSDIVRLFEARGLATDWAGSVGFNQIDVVRELALRLRLRQDWPWTQTHADGEVVRHVGAGDHVAYVGTKLKSALGGARDMNSILADGRKRAASLGGKPILVHIEPEGPEQADTVIRVSHDLLASQIGASETEIEVDDSVVVFPGPVAALNRLIASNRIPVSMRALVRERDRWLPLRRVSEVQPAALPAKIPLIARIKPDLGARLAARTDLRESRWAQRLQPLIDQRENDILGMLSSPSSFPFRLTHVVEGRVLLAIHSLCSGGAERQIVNTARGLKQRGLDDVHILAENLELEEADRFYLPKALAASASVSGSRPHPAELHPWVMSTPAIRDIIGSFMGTRILAAASRIRDLAPEVVSINLDWPNISVGLAAVMAGVPHVFISGRNLAPTSFTFFQWFMYPAYRALLRCPQVRLLNNSEAGRDDYARWLRVPPDSIKVLRNGLETGDFVPVNSETKAALRKALDLPQGVKVVTGAFRLSAEKRPLLWIQAAEKIGRRFSDAVFLLCGTGAMRGEVEALIAQLGLQDRIRLLGVRSDLNRIFAASDLVMMASEHEGTPNALIEAQATGIAVVTTPAFGAAEAVEDGITGRVVRDETAEGLATTVIAVLESPQFLESARERGPRYIAERFGMERMIEDTLVTFIDAGAMSLVPFAADVSRYSYRIPLKVIADEGLCFRAHVPELAHCADGVLRNDSPVMILEDGVALGPAHTAHNVIRACGGGSFSHWQNELYFSTRDGSDPRENGRQYEAVVLRWPAAPAPKQHRT